MHTPMAVRCSGAKARSSGISAGVLSADCNSLLSDVVSPAILIVLSLAASEKRY